MSSPFNLQETCYLIAWAKEDHLGAVNGPARSMQRGHDVRSAVMGQLFARLSTVTGRSQHDLVEGPASDDPITWPWSTSEELESRLKELLPESTRQFLDELGALPSHAN